MNNPLFIRKIAFPSNDGLLLIPENEISFVKSENIYAYVHNSHEKHFITLSLKEIEATLSPTLFYRCHKSYIVNLFKIIKITKAQNCYVLLQNGQEIPVSRSKKKEMLQLLIKRVTRDE
ncbi:MAG: LytTR family DNA-binding domain-containing protein [Saprospiraceae bacterium]|nr:LytTR family DNA-binding domain-containing protein [Saprospiraceae bacterium]